MTQHVAGLGADQFRRLEHLGHAGVLALQAVALVVAQAGEPTEEHLVETGGALDRAFRRATLVEDRDGRLVGLGRREGVAVDKRPEDLVGLLLGAHDDRVPVNPMRAAFGSAPRRLACRAEPCDRCASSTSTTIASSSLSTGNASTSPSLVDEVSRYFWIIAITMAGPGRPSSSLTLAEACATCTVSPTSSAVLRELML